MRKIGLILLCGMMICQLAGCRNAAPSDTGGAPPEPSAKPSPSAPAVSPEESPEGSSAAPVDSSGGAGESAGPSSDTPSEINVDRLGNVFGFADDSGSRLITIENDDTITSPEQYNLAVGNNGEAVRIEYVGRQEETSGNTYRQTAANFENLPGYVYKAAGGGLARDKTYFLSSDSVIGPNALKALKSTLDSSSQTGMYLKADSGTIDKIETLRSRRLVDGELISEAADGGEIYLFVFERAGDDMLASIAYINGDTVLFKDYPAKYDESSTWRVDAGDEPGLFSALFLADSDAGVLLGITWAGPEGENSYILKEENGALRETGLGCNRYWSP